MSLLGYLKVIPYTKCEHSLWDHALLSYAADKQTDRQTNRRSRTVERPTHVVGVGLADINPLGQNPRQWQGRTKPPGNNPL